jgi:hypothetical protein
MAATLLTTFPINGTRNFVARIDITGDSAGDVTATPIIDPLAAISGVQASVGLTGLPTNLKIKSINYNLAGFKAALLWDADTDVLACALSEYDGEIDFFEMGAPLLNNAGTGKTGKLLLSTSGIAAGDYGTIIIKGYHE